MTNPLFNTRTDCERDNQALRLPNASTSGFGQWKAKRGYWVVYRGTGFEETSYGRVIGRVTCQGVVYVEVARLVCGMSAVHTDWVLPERITECRRAPPRKALEFICGPWTGMQTVSDKMHHGFAIEPEDQI